MQRSALCRSRRELSNAYLVAKFGFDTAENEPAKVCLLNEPPPPRGPAPGCARRRSRRSARTGRSQILVSVCQLFHLLKKIAEGRVVLWSSGRCGALELLLSVHNDQRNLCAVRCSSVDPRGKVGARRGEEAERLDCEQPGARS